MEINRGMPQHQESQRQTFGKTIGLGIVTGAADDDPSAIGTYASAGAQFGTRMLWIAPVILPMNRCLSLVQAGPGLRPQPILCHPRLLSEMATMDRAERCHDREYHPSVTVPRSK
jgi:hypothetical protein